MAFARGLLLAAFTAAAADAGADQVGAARSRSLLQTWGQALDGTNSKVQDTPVTRVVNLLKDMQKTLQKEMDEDEALYDKLSCWCNNNEYEKDGAISDSEAKIAELEASIEGLTAKSSGLQTSIKELESESASDKAALAEATALREKQQKEFHGGELDSTQAVENLKAAIEVLSKHEQAPDSTVAGGAIFKSEKDSWSSLLSVRSSSWKSSPWAPEHETSLMARTLDDFMRRNGFDSSSEDVATPRKFLQQDAGDSLAVSAQPAPAGWSNEESTIVRRALKSASAFVQSRHGGSYYPAYNSRSGEIMGVLRQLKEEMEADLSEAQKREQARAAAFEELRSAKSSEISNGDRMAEQKEDEYANTKNALAEAKEDLDQEQAALSADQKFRINLKKTCSEASTNFDARKNARLQEIKAVSETIEILMQDKARDAMTGTYNFMQVKKGGRQSNQDQRQKAAQVLRKSAKALKQPQLSVLATTVELDAFSKVKKAIDDMIKMLGVQQKDEVKKNDYCKASLQENEMTTSKTEDHKADLEAKSAELGSNIQMLEENIASAKKQIAQLQLELQRASEDRKTENLDFQKTVADQSATISVLKTALDRLATYYDKEALIQKASKATAGQTPPVPQMEYSPSKGASGVMQLIEKLIVEAKGLTADSVKSESEAQAAYEQTVADTNGSVAALQQEVTTKTKAKADATKEKLQTDSEIADTTKELEGLSKYNSELHGECDYLLKNFNTRQEARQQEIEALQQAKQILSGASLN